MRQIYFQTVFKILVSTAVVSILVYKHRLVIKREEKNPVRSAASQKIKSGACSNMGRIHSIRGLATMKGCLE